MMKTSDEKWGFNFSEIIFKVKKWTSSLTSSVQSYFYSAEYSIFILLFVVFNIVLLFYFTFCMLEFLSLTFYNT